MLCVYKEDKPFWKDVKTKKAGNRSHEVPRLIKLDASWHQTESKVYSIVKELTHSAAS